jgi:16S rRNA processing protein RimM
MEPGDQRLTADPAYLVVGRIGRPHGVRGEVRLEVLTDFPARRFAPGSHLYVGREEDAAPMPVVVESVRAQNDVLLVRFDVARDRESAAALNGMFALVPRSDAVELGPDAWYAHELVGLEVVTADDGAVVGQVTDLIETGSADVLEVRGAEGRTHLVPLIGTVIASVDLAARRITITPLPGLLD